MKKIFSVLLDQVIIYGFFVISFLFVGHSKVTMASTPVEILVQVNNIYTPKGFDSNDNIELIISGTLPNLCHKSPNTQVEIQNDTIYIEMKALNYEESNPFCPQVILPFMKSVYIGLLEKGNYKIVVNNLSPFQKESSLSVNESSGSTIDDFIYANVDYIEKSLNGKVIGIVGYNPSTCFELDRVEFISNGLDTYSVLPIMKQVSDHCPMKMVPFKYEATIPDDIKKNQFLLHVRSMDGNSVNTLVSSESDQD